MWKYGTPTWGSKSGACRKHLGMRKNELKQAIERQMSEVDAKERYASMGLQKWHL